MPGCGPDTADIVLVGEAPGFHEGRSGIPFTGASGKLLEAVLRDRGLDRDSVWLTNACLCRPPDNRTPTAKEVKCCWPRLKKEIEARRPHTIVTLGNTSTQVVLDSRTGITQQRVGQPKESPLFPGVRVIPTFHPAACLRVSDSFPFLVTDLGKINPSQEVWWEDPQWDLFDDEVSAVDALQKIHRACNEIVVDIEVGIDREAYWGQANQYKWLCIGLSWRHGQAAVIGEEALKSDQVWRWIKVLIEEHPVIAQNGIFDMIGCSVKGKMNLWFDTMLASYALDERPGTHSLDFLATEHLGAPPWKREIDKYKGKDESYAVIPRDVLYKYCAFDAAAEWYMYERQVPELESHDVRRVHDRLVYYSPTIAHMQQQGIKIDLDYLGELHETYQGTLDELKKALNPFVDNPNSPKQVKESLHDQGIRVASTDADNLTAILERTDPTSETAEFCRLMLQWRKEAKLYGTYIKGFTKHLYKGRIYSHYKLHGTVTGRLAGKNPSLLNAPRGNVIRDMFVPDSEDFVWIQGDYKTIELRVMAVESEDPYLIEVLSDHDRDLHNEVATTFFGPDFTKNQRVRAKAVVYGLGYGREAPSLAAEFGIPVREAQTYLNEFFEMIPMVVAWKQRIKNQIFVEGGDLVTHFGRHRRFWLITRDNARDVEKEGYAFIPQSTANDINLTAASRLHQEYGFDVRLTVHDSILVQVRREEAAERAEVMGRVMEQTAVDVYSDKVAFPVDLKIGDRWGEV